MILESMNTALPELASQLPARIVEWVPETVHDQKVYMWLGIVQVDTGRTLALFDAPVELKEAIGTRYVFEVVAFLPDIERLSDAQYEVGSWIDSMANPEIVEEERPSKLLGVFPRSKRFYVVYRPNPIENPYCVGKVISLDGSGFVMDVGCGTIRVDNSRPKDRVEVNPGMFVRISQFRLDVKGYRRLEQ